MTEKPLTEEIRDFQRSKKVLIPILLLVGLAGLFLPILPGVALLFLGYLLIFPRQGENFLQKIRSTLKI